MAGSAKVVYVAMQYACFERPFPILIANISYRIVEYQPENVFSSLQTIDYCRPDESQEPVSYWAFVRRWDD
jgi:hypothetical protein